jgi:polyhydroxybutyrate depolymerase
MGMDRSGGRRRLRTMLSGGLMGMAGALLAAAGAVTAETEASPAPSGAGEDGPSCLPALSAGSQTLTIEVDDQARGVIVHVPASHARGLAPGVIAFHGYSSYATDLEATSQLSALSDQDGFVVAYPQALHSPTEWHFAGNSGYDQRDLALTESLMQLLIDQACVDPGRIVLAGHSMGGGMASDAACHLADRVAGLVLVSALWFELPCDPVRPVPVIGLHAVDDPVLPYAGGPVGTAPGAPDQLPVELALATWAAHDGCDAMPVITPTDGGVMLTWPDGTVPVVLHRRDSGGHDWPVLASDLIVEMVAAG